MSIAAYHHEMLPTAAIDNLAPINDIINFLNASIDL